MSHSQTTDNGYFYECNCCPYGYHIDLGFVQYCATIGQQVERSGSFKRRRDRRRQRQSMEVLLGLAPPMLNVPKEAPLPPIRDVPKSPLIQDALHEVVSDFERTLQRSKTKLSNNLPDVTAVTGDGHVSGGPDFDTVSVESCGLSPIALQNIREQMALSLERTRELEKKVQMIPTLQAQLSSLKEERKMLLLQLNEEQAKFNRLNSNNTVLMDNVDNGNRRASAPPPPPPRRDFGVTASVLTRNIGVGQQTPHTRSVSTATYGDNSYMDRWLPEKQKFLNGSSMPEKNIIVVSKGTQTISPKEKRDEFVQTITCSPVRMDSHSQTYKVPKADSSTETFVASASKSIQIKADTATIGVSDHCLSDILCSKCNVLRKTVSIGTSDILTESQEISLAALSMARSKSFNLGEERLNLSHIRNVATQYDPQTPSHKSTQSETKNASKQTQHELVQTHKSIQYEYTGQTKCTDTIGLGPIMTNKSVECVTERTKTADFGCSTDLPLSSKDIASPCSKCSKDNVDPVKKEESPTPSRIPRPQIPTTPVECRKFKRQDTYTKIPAPEKSPSGFSALELVTSSAISPESTTFEKIIHKFKVTDEPENTYNGEQHALKQQESKILENVAASSRKQKNPSKEMQGAIKVLNDSLQKQPGRDIRGQLKNANAIIEAEWFKISTAAHADPADVEDYLDRFEDISSGLLEYIVNMVDTSGNTAMHYAVSHGNFDVVSILLDSKVCDINKQNKAGYTSVMLVSLAEVSPAHINVVKRLFSLADVNIRAKQHGQTALMLAVSHGRLDMAKMLLTAGADINIQDEDGSTALMCAAEHGHAEIVKLFLAHPDCDSSISDVDGSTALKIAMEAGHHNIGVLLYAHERNLGPKTRPKKAKPASPKTPSTPPMQRSASRALQTNK